MFENFLLKELELNPPQNATKLHESSLWTNCTPGELQQITPDLSSYSTAYYAFKNSESV